MNSELFSFQTYEMQGGSVVSGNGSGSGSGNEIVGGISVQKYLKLNRINTNDKSQLKRFNNSIVPVGLLVNTIGAEAYSKGLHSDSSSDSDSDSDSSSDSDSNSDSNSDSDSDNKIARPSKSKYPVVTIKAFDALIFSVATDLGKSRSKPNNGNKTIKHLPK